jgi:cation diffusion facilitator CzcD-associated flavoprotein CzcO
MKQYRVMERAVDEKLVQDWEWEEEFSSLGAARDYINSMMSYYSKDFEFKIQEREVSEWRDSGES